MYQLTIQQIEEVIKEIEDSGLILTKEEMFLKLKEREDAFLEEFEKNQSKLEI